MNATSVAPSAAPRTAGEEFRDDIRKRLPANVLGPLTELSPVRSTLAILQTAMLIAIVIFLAVRFWSVPVAILAVMLIAPLQHALFVLAHDAAHYRLYQTRWLNDLMGRIAGTLGGIPMCAYRVTHRLHHNHLYQAQDPDIALHGGYPRGRRYLLKKLGKDILGLTAWKTYAYFFGAPMLNTETGQAQRPLDDTSPQLRNAARRDRWGVLGFHLAVLIVAFAMGWGWYYLVLWVLPLATLLQAILRLRAICEHGALTDFSSPLTAARTNRANLWQRFLLFPHHVNYHIEHHLYPAVPHYRLPALHVALQRHGMLDGAEMARLGATFSRIFGEPRPADPKEQAVTLVPGR
jgi:fatty acid desaturase